MLITIEDLLDAAALDSVHRLLADGRFVDGAASAGSRAAPAKHNAELPTDAPQNEPLNRIVMGALVSHPAYLSAVLPLRVATPIYARYDIGMGYGAHLDDPVMGVGGRYRSDVAISVFLNGPDDYAGGALCIDTGYGETALRPPAGSAVLYPAGFRHRVSPVTGGSRLVAVTWAQSLVPDVAQRSLLYDLARARDELMKTAPDSHATALVETSYANLVRRWSRP